MKAISVFQRFLSISMAWLVAVQLLFASGGIIQNDPEGTAPPDSLKINILDGEGALNNIKTRTAREPIVQVEDENHKPVAGATVIFLLPSDGAGGTFYNGARSVTSITDSTGKAVARGLRPNSVSGDFQIRVTANYQGKVGHSVIHQTNSLAGLGAAAASGFAVKWLIIGLVAAGAAGGGIYAATRSGGKTPAPAGVGINAGTGTVGPPQ